MGIVIDMISEVIVIKNVHIIKCPIFNDYEVTISCNLDQKVKIIEKIRKKIINTLPDKFNVYINVPS
jgi:hypothetical protein